MGGGKVVVVVRKRATTTARTAKAARVSPRRHANGGETTPFTEVETSPE